MELMDEYSMQIFVISISKDLKANAFLFLGNDFMEVSGDIFRNNHVYVDLSVN